MLFAALSLSVFLDLIAANFHVVAALRRSLFREALGRSCESFCCVNNGTNRCSLKRAFQWLSYCIFVKFGPLLENSGCWLDLQAADGYLTPFLTGLIGKKSSNEADYTPNR